MKQLVHNDAFLHAGVLVQRHLLATASLPEVRLAVLARVDVDKVGFVSSRDEANASVSLDLIHGASHQSCLVRSFGRMKKSRKFRKFSTQPTHNNATISRCDTAR